MSLKFFRLSYINYLMYPGKEADEALDHLYTNQKQTNKIILWLFLAK